MNFGIYSEGIILPPIRSAL